MSANFSGAGIVNTMLSHLLLYMQSQDIILPQPARTGGMTFSEAVASRHSSREFDENKELDLAQIGQILWSTVGVNRENAPEPAPGEKKVNRSNPTAVDAQEISLYIFGKTGVWVYLPDSHSLEKVVDGDHRGLVAGTKEFTQDYVLDAPCSVVIVADLSMLPKVNNVKMLGLMDAGIASENLTLACSALGLATVPRATMDIEGICRLLNLSPTQIPALNSPIGFPK